MKTLDYVDMKNFYQELYPNFKFDSFTSMNNQQKMARNLIDFEHKSSNDSSNSFKANLSMQVDDFRFMLFKFIDKDYSKFDVSLNMDM
jgi:hypothetical protein